MYVFHLYNSQSGGVSLLFLALFEVLTVSWGYGANRFARDIETMIGYKIWPWWPIAWKFCSPLVILGKQLTHCGQDLMKKCCCCFRFYFYFAMFGSVVNFR